MPHREPMLLVDSSCMKDEGVVSEYTIKEDEYFTRGHFPGNPIVPGVILCEIMAQGSVLLFKDKLVDKIALYAGMDKVRFRRTVRPGDTVKVYSKIVSSRIILCRAIPLKIVSFTASLEKCQYISASHKRKITVLSPTKAWS
jgi:3-hydroxyacyl-[acyl-carrier-protein] dehydratase